MSEFLTDGIENSRAKDFKDPFRLAMFGNEKEMEKVIGSIHENEFIAEAKLKSENFKQQLQGLIADIKK
jgi:DNA polymerase III alpha subunit (gram-positive type)